MGRMFLDNPNPILSILVPSSLEEPELHHSIPLLCLIFDVHPERDTITWDVMEGMAHEWQDVDMIDGKGVISIGSLKLIPPERWSQGGPYACSDQNRSLSAIVPAHSVSLNMLSTNTGKCSSGFYFGVPCLILIFLVIPSLVLLCRKHLAGGRAQFPFSSAPQEI